MATLQFSAQGIDTSNNFDALPAGEYTVVVTESDMKTTQSGTGRYLSLTFEVQAPESFRGRRLWDNLNLENPSAKAVEIAQRQLAQLCVACGLQGITDSEQLHNVPVVAIVKVDRSDSTRNQIKGYKAAGQALQTVPTTPAPAAAPAPQQAAPQGEAAMSQPPWMAAQQ
jgi:hypothetical protein